MLKLIKVEFRKGLVGALVLLGIAAALQAYYLISLYSSREGHTIAAALLLVWVTFAMGVFVFARGITAYSRELGSRTGYMLFLTPNPSLKIIGSKFLYTFLLALLLGSAMLGRYRLSPAELAARQTLVTLELPDNEVFNDDKWALWLASFDVEQLKHVVDKLAADVESGHLDGYPKLIREEGRKYLEPQPEKKGFFEQVVEAVAGWFKGETEEEKAARLAREAEEARAKEEMLEWVRTVFRDVFVFSNGSAGSDGHTIRMMTQRGRVFPFLMYLSMTPNSSHVEQMNIVVYLKDHWVDVTKLLETSKAGEEKKASDGSEEAIVGEFTALAEGSGGLIDFLDKVFLDVPGGAPYELPTTGLEKVDRSANMAPAAEEQTPETHNRMSRPKE